MEKLKIAPDWGVELESPSCDLKYPGCVAEAVAGLRVHGCAFHFACAKCVETFRARVKKSYQSFAQMRCSKCKINFTTDKYYEIIDLNS